MSRVRVAVRHEPDVPSDRSWLGPREREVLAGLGVAGRRRDWLRGRWTAHQLLPEGVEVLAADDGAPEVWRGAERVAISLSISHSGPLAFCGTAAAPTALGVDVERVRPRRPAFARTWFTEAEQAAAGADPERVTAVWAAKEAALKAVRTGLRADTRSVEVTLPVLGPDWARVATRIGDRSLTGWIRRSGSFVYAVVSDPATPPPDAG